MNPFEVKAHEFSHITFAAVCCAFDGKSLDRFNVSFDADTTELAFIPSSDTSKAYTARLHGVAAYGPVLLDKANTLEWVRCPSFSKEMSQQDIKAAKAVNIPTLELKVIGLASYQLSKSVTPCRRAKIFKLLDHTDKVEVPLSTFFSMKDINDAIEFARGALLSVELKKAPIFHEEHKQYAV